MRRRQLYRVPVNGLSEKLHFGATREGVPDSCIGDGRTNLLLRQYASGPLRCAVGGFDFGEVEPEMAAVIVFAEDEFPVGAGEGSAELVAVAALL